MATVLQEATAKIDEYARGMISGSGSTLFEELGLYYIGPIDGHNLDLIIAMLQGAALPSPARPLLASSAASAPAESTHHCRPTLMTPPTEQVVFPQRCLKC